jgi:hypothetical protein
MHGSEEIVASVGSQEEHASRSMVTPLQVGPRTRLKMAFVRKRYILMVLLDMVF